MKPMREPTYFVLASLLEGPLHGYGIVKKTDELSLGRVKLAAGTLYGALDRLVEEGLISNNGEEVVEGRARRYYRITKSGRQAVAEEASRLAQAASAVTGLLPILHHPIPSLIPRLP